MGAVNLTDSRILIVDDQLANLKVLETVLGMAGYGNIRCLSDSREALQVCLEFAPDLIMLDLHMPHVDGLMVLDQLAGVIDEDDYVPVLMLTGDATPAAKEKALSHGAKDFLSKPLNATEVQLRVKNLLQTRNLHLQLKAQNIQLRGAKEEADRANQAKSDFLSRMSHELRTPLNAVLGFAQLLEMNAPRPEQIECIQHIRQGGKHLLDLINEVLDVSRIEAGRLSLTVEPIAVRAVIDDAVGLIDPLARQRNIEIHRLDSDWRVNADRQRLKQVLINLLSNAVKYNVENGRVEIRCERRLDGWVRIGVTDSGLGIAEEKLVKLFKPFERVHEERGYIEGTGLGLALCRGLMNAMEGQIGVDSTVGEGSTFWLDLREAAPESEAPFLDRHALESPLRH